MSIQNAALIAADGSVANVIVIDTNGDYQPPKGHTMRVLAADEHVDTSWRHDGKKFVPPPGPPVDPGQPPARAGA